MRSIHTLWFTSVDFDTPEGEFFLKSMVFVHDGNEKIASYNYICPIRHLDEIDSIENRMFQEPQFQRWFFQVEGKECVVAENANFIRNLLDEREKTLCVSGVGE